MKKDDCIFCKIANGEFNTEFILETDKIVAFRDINPQAPEHILIVPKEHFENIVSIDDKELFCELLEGIKKVTEKIGLKEFRTVINTGKQAGQTVFHTHIHILGGKELKPTFD